MDPFAASRQAGSSMPNGFALCFVALTGAEHPASICGIKMPDAGPFWLGGCGRAPTNERAWCLAATSSTANPEPDSVRNPLVDHSLQARVEPSLRRDVQQECGSRIVRARRQDMFG